jgi:hypothetical protein
MFALIPDFWDLLQQAGELFTAIEKRFHLVFL